MLASVVAAFVYRYGKEPTLEAAFATKSPKSEIGCQEDVLTYVLDFPGPAQQSIGQGPDVARVSFDNSVKSRFVASTESPDQKFVINRLGHGYDIRLTAQRNLTEKMREK